MNESVTESLQEEANAKYIADLNRAIEKGDLASIRDLVDKKKLIDLNELVNVVPIEGSQVLILAVENGQLEVLKYLIEEKKGDVNFLAHGQTPLSVAAERGHLDLVKYLVEKGANIDPITRLEKHPLLAAAAKGRLDILKYFIEEKNVDVNAIDYGRHNALDTAVENKEFDAMLYLIDRGANTKSTICSAAHHGNFEVLRYFVEQLKFDINVEDEMGETPLHKACRKGSYDMVKYLVQHGADTTKKNHLNFRPVELAQYCEDYPLENKAQCDRVVQYMKTLPKTRKRRSVPYSSPLPQHDGPVSVICSRLKNVIGLERDVKQDYFSTSESPRNRYTTFDNFLMLANACSRFLGGANDYNARRLALKPAVMQREKESFILGALATPPTRY